MKKFLSVLLMVAGLMSCGDDDKPFIPELNKLIMTSNMLCKVQDL